MMTIGDFLRVTTADDYFIVMIRSGKETLYYGYENEVPDEIKSLKITEIYLDWADEAVGIEVSPK